jgi:phospholipid-translocating ATPase
MVISPNQEMELKKLHIGTMSFDSEVMGELQQQLELAYSSSTMDTGIAFKRNLGSSGRIREVVLALAVCHNVTPSIDDLGNLTFQAASPDEIAIVNWTAQMGLRLVYRDIHSMKLIFGDREFTYRIRHVFPFSSETKRMGIILEDTDSGKITFYQKGADSIMSKIVMRSDWLEEECLNMAREGYRTLVVGRKPLSRELYDEFEDQYNHAKSLTFERQESIQRVIASYLERDLELLGLTGVEDQLQENVKLTLELLRNAGLRIWMLTGDKVETATCIALSSKLFMRNQMIHQITNITDMDSALDRLDQIRAIGDSCLVIDGSSLQFYLDHAPGELIDLALTRPAVVCSRCTPTQKAEIVRLINQSTNKRTCAIGDGGNDVSMIQAAHVGVGLVGKEGKQASLAADFSITQFQYLSRLLYIDLM